MKLRLSAKTWWRKEWRGTLGVKNIKISQHMNNDPTKIRFLFHVPICWFVNHTIKNLSLFLSKGPTFFCFVLRKCYKTFFFSLGVWLIFQVKKKEKIYWVSLFFFKFSIWTTCGESLSFFFFFLDSDVLDDDQFLLYVCRSWRWLSKRRRLKCFRCNLQSNSSRFWYLILTTQYLWN